MFGRDWLKSQISYNISVDIGSASDSSPDEIASTSYLLINGGRFELFSYLVPLSVLFRVSDNTSRVSDNKPPSSNCTSVMILPVFYLEYVA